MPNLEIKYYSSESGYVSVLTQETGVNTKVLVTCHCALCISYACEMKWIFFWFLNFSFDSGSVPKYHIWKYFKIWKCVKPKHFWVPNFLSERYATCQHCFSKLRSITLLAESGKGRIKTKRPLSGCCFQLPMLIGFQTHRLMLHILYLP